MNLRTPFVRTRRRLRQSFEADVLSFIDEVYGEAIRLTEDRRQAEDLVQATYSEAFRFCSRSDREPNPKVSLFACLHRLYRAGVGVEIGAESTGDSGEAGLVTDRGAPREAPPAWTVSAAALKGALDSLPAPIRHAVWLRDVDDFAIAEVARILAVPLATVSRDVSRGRLLLAQRLTAHETARQPEERHHWFAVKARREPA